MSGLCEMEGICFRFVRFGDEIRVAEDIGVLHKELIRDIWGSEISESQVRERLENEAENVDMGFIMRFNGRCNLSDTSSHYGVPKADALPMVRKRTVEMLSEQYPNIKFESID
ncbi:MAG: hypothetical protein ACOX6N_01890 [Patescibacteria group bacterium]|jgi:hypothetical protein